MIGVVVVTHGGIGLEMVKAVHRIIPEVTHLVAVAVESNDPPEHIRSDIQRALEKVNAGEGVLILTDMFGGTPSNVCLSFLNLPAIEVVSGVNLPMLIKLATYRQRAESLSALSQFIQQYGQRNVVIASRILSGEQRA
ncbi:MAG: PTS sugar transporter subunit IIA [Deltaproteobacteria bacterium]|nr:PTS sugar transporter subunit IIA [Deltaproteobacteria bacterium]